MHNICTAIRSPAVTAASFIPWTEPMSDTTGNIHKWLYIILMHASVDNQLIALD